MSESTLRIIGLVGIIYLLILFFKAQGAFIRAVATYFTGELAWMIIRFLIAVTTGYAIYICIAFLGLLNRIRSLSDIFSILAARPSEIGGIGVLGACVGIFFAIFTFLHWSPSSQNSGTGRVVYYETFRRRVTVVGILRKIISKIPRK